MTETPNLYSDALPNVSRDARNVNWEQQWARVPEPWRAGVYRYDREPHNEVFSPTAGMRDSRKTHEVVDARYERIRRECAWWLWTIWADGSRKVDPSLMASWGRAIGTLATARLPFGGSENQASVLDFDPALVVRESLRAFHQKHERYPSQGRTRNFEQVSYSIHAYLDARCTPGPWWARDTWSLLLDDRIPRRAHEPKADQTLNIGGIQPEWLREGVRFWLSQTLTHDVYTWSSARGRLTNVGGYYGRWCQTRTITDPAVAVTLSDLRAQFMDFLAYLRSPEAALKGRAIAPSGVNAIQSQVQGFYAFMADNADAAAAFTGDERWKQLTVNHTRLWAPQYASKRSGNKQEITYYTEPDIAALGAHIPILGTPTDQLITIDHAGTSRTFRGLGDPQAERIWRIQALTGRRASEICMLDRDPYTLLDLGNGPDAGSADPDALVARLRYQQTKVDDVDPTIVVPQTVVDLIREQQQWLIKNRPEATNSPYLFLQPRSNRLGLRHRSYTSYSDALKRLNHVTNLTDSSGKPLLFTQTHRLRHTRATDLLNNGVPIHVVMRYLGHKSPEMTMRYAETLESVALDQFTRHKQIGANGRDIIINPRDLMDLNQLDRRADRILPNGLCLLPPTKTCDKGNACLPCGSFATDVTHLEDHRQQRERIAALIQVRRAQHEKRHGTPMPDSNRWLENTLRELASLDAIIVRLEQEDASNGEAVKGAGASAKSVPLTLITDPLSKHAAHQVLRDQLDP